MSRIKNNIELVLKLLLFSFSIFILSLLSLCTESYESKILQIEENPNEFKILSSNSSSSLVYSPEKKTSSVKFKNEYSINASIDFEEISTYSTVQNFSLQTRLFDINSKIIPYAKIIFKDEASNILFQNFTNSEGVVYGSFQTTNLNLNLTCIIQFSNNEFIKFQIPTLFKVDQKLSKIKNITSINLPVEFEKLSLPKKEQNLSSIHKFPQTGFASLIFEDSFPSSMDGDYNDYIVQFKFEEKINSQGEILEIKGDFVHVAKGSNYNHSLHLRFLNDKNVFSDISDYSPHFQSKISHSTNRNETITTLPVNEINLIDGLLILDDSNRTISSKNVSNGSTYKSGYTSSFKINFDKSIPRDKIGFPPYDTYLKILSKPFKVNLDDESISINNIAQVYQEIHLPNYYFGLDKKDKYLDSKNYPYSILVPQEWAWQFEGKDIRNERFTGYKMFSKWAESKGKENFDWYKYPNTEKLFPVPINSSNLTAYIQGVDLTSEKVMILFLIIVLVLMTLYLRKKFIKA